MIDRGNNDGRLLRTARGEVAGVPKCVVVTDTAVLVAELTRDSGKAIRESYSEMETVEDVAVTKEVSYIVNLDSVKKL